MRNESKDMLLAAAFGWLSGMRSMAGPSIVGRRILKVDHAADLLALGAVGEMLVDKHPKTPNRNAREPLVARTLAGAATGAAIMVSGLGPSRSRVLRSRRFRWPSGDGDTAKAAVIGALIGGTMAYISTHATYYLRRVVADRTEAPNVVLGAAEDAIVYGTGIALSREL